MKTFFLSIIFFLSFSFLGIAQNDQDLIPLKSMAPDGIGPLSLPHLRHMVLGSAFVYNGDCPDLFIAGTGKTTELYLYKWLRNTENGVPIFDKPHKIASPFKLKGTIFQTDDHNVHALWLKKDSVILKNACKTDGPWKNMSFFMLFDNLILNQPDGGYVFGEKQ